MTGIAAYGYKTAHFDDDILTFDIFKKHNNFAINKIFANNISQF